MQMKWNGLEDSNISMDIKITEHLAKGNKEWKEIVPAALPWIQKALRKTNTKTTGTSNRTIKLIFKEETDLNKLQGRIYPLTRQEGGEMNKFIDENLESGRIRCCNRKSHLHFSLLKRRQRICDQFRIISKFNDATIKDRYPLPLINELLDKLRMHGYTRK